MSEHRSAIRHIVGSPGQRRRRWLMGAVGALGASGLVLGGVGVPVSAEDVNAGGTPSASVAVQEGCVTAVVGTGQADGSVNPQGEGGQLQTNGEGTATASVCRDDSGGPPLDPGGSVPDDLDDVVPSDLEDVVPEDLGGSVGGELVGEVTGALEDLPGDGGGPLPGEPGGLPGGLEDVAPGDVGDFIPGGGPGGPGGDLPSDLDDVVPGDPGGVLPDDSAVDLADLLDRLADIIPASIDDGDAPDGNGGGGPAVNGAVTGSVSASVAAGGEGTDGGAPTDLVLGAELEQGDAVPAGSAVSPGGMLPRTGGGLGNGVLRLAAILGLGGAVLGWANRRRCPR